MFSSFSINHVDPEIRTEAWQQLRTVLWISFSPLIVGFIGIILLYPRDEISGSALWLAFVSVFLHGELYFYAMSTCAQIFVLPSFSEKRGLRGVRLSSGVFVFFCGTFMALYIGQGEVRNAILHGALSVGLLLAAVIINYRVMVLSQKPPPMPEDGHRKAIDTMKELDTEYE